MDTKKLGDLQFDKGVGVTFNVTYEGRRVGCHVEQSDAFLARKATGRAAFPDVVHRYGSLICHASLLAIERAGISADPWGNLVAASDLELAETPDDVAT